MNWNRVQAAGRNAEAMARNEQEKSETEAGISYEPGKRETQVSASYEQEMSTM